MRARTLWVLSVIATLGTGLAERSTFEVVSIAHHNLREYGAPLQVDASQLRAVGFSVLSLTRYAYSVRAFQVSGPDWIGSELYDVRAKLPSGSGKQEAPAMMQVMLAERFHMKTHWEIREQPAYALVVRRSGPKLKPALDDEPKRLMISTAGYVNARGVSLADLCEILAGQVQRPVVDRTSIAGHFNIIIETGLDSFRQLTPDDSATIDANSTSAAPPIGSTGLPIFTALRGLGLELQGIKAPLKFLVIDSVDKEFTPN